MHDCIKILGSLAYARYDSLRVTLSAQKLPRLELLAFDTPSRRLA